ncbi:MAG: hypothetical protein HUJ91_04310 [Bacteroidales bacterium]|nr:hypothetical protein [Bacteroidales bacterium]
MSDCKLTAGCAERDITPRNSQFLYGYPYVERMSTGAHDPLTSSALYVSDGRQQALFISNEIIYLTKASVARIREGIAARAEIPSSNIFVATTHTHSGPVTVEIVMSRNDSVVKPVDPEYLQYVENSAIEAGCNAIASAVPAEAAFAVADATGVGTNRHDPAGPRDMDVPVMVVRNRATKQYLGCMLVCSMHPTVLHEDSKLCSGDFPHFTRARLQSELLGSGCPVVYFTGTAGDQSPRHVTRANTFAEAQRLGEIVADSVISHLKEINFSDEVPVKTEHTLLELPKRIFPSVEDAARHRHEAKSYFEKIKTDGSASPQQIRTAEVDWFGSEEALLLATLAEKDELGAVYQTCLPAEINVIKVGDWSFVGWPGEVFAEFGLTLKGNHRNVSLITYANGELQGYVVTKEAHEKGFYEAGNSFFDISAGYLMLEATDKILNRI